jgi:hypothetical protein
MTFRKRIRALWAPTEPQAQIDPVCVQDGALRAYIWPTKRQFSYEVVNSFGQKLLVGAEETLEHARRRALAALRRLR